MKSISIAPDWNGSRSPFRHTWEGMVNIDQFRWMLRADVLEQLKMAHDEIGARHVRAVGFFDDELRTFVTPDPTNFGNKKAKPGPHTNWQVTDFIVDRLLNIGIAPMLTTTFMPSCLASDDNITFSTKSCSCPPGNWNVWSKLVSRTVRHCMERFGKDVVQRWYFEVWNEPKLKNFFSGDQSTWHKLWQVTWEAIKSVDPTLRVGGPSAARGEWLIDLLDFADKNKCLPDFVISHIYNNDSPDNPLSPFDGPQGERTNKSPQFAAGVIRGGVRQLREWGFSGEIHWNEWGRSWWPCFPSRETANEAGFIGKTMAEVSQEADLFAYWCLSDVYDQVGYGSSTFHGNYGMLNLQGLRKPNYHAHQLLHRLGRERVPVSGKGLNAHLNAIATLGASGLGARDGEDAVLIYSFETRETIEAGVQPDFPQTEYNVSIELPKQVSPDQLRLTLVTETSNNILQPWRAMKSPDYLTAGQLAEFRAANELQSSAVKLIRQGRTAAFTFKGPGLALLEIAR